MKVKASFFLSIGGLLLSLAFAPSVFGQQRSSGGAWSDRSLDGVLQPFRSIEVATVETGIVRKILVEPGDRVVAGQALFELDMEGVKAQIKVKQAEASARGKLEQAQHELEFQTRRFSKLTKLVEEGRASQVELERALSDLQVAKGRVSSEEESILIFQADLERSLRQLEDRTIRAPCDGIVTEVLKELGEAVAANSTGLVRMVDVSRLKATFAVPESERIQMIQGGMMKVQLSNGKITQGTISYLPPVADAETGWFMVTVLIPNLDEQIIGSRCQRIP